MANPRQQRSSLKRFKTPRLYWVEFRLANGRFVSKMLGVAFTNLEAQIFRDRFRLGYSTAGRYYRWPNVLGAELHFEKLREPF